MLMVLFIAGDEEMPLAVSHKEQGRVVYVYEPTLGDFVRILSYFLYFLSHMLIRNIANLSIRPSVHLSVTLRYRVETA